MLTTRDGPSSRFTRGLPAKEGSVSICAREVRGPDAGWRRMSDEEGAMLEAEVGGQVFRIHVRICKHWGNN